MRSNRRGFLIGLGAALAAPAVVRAESLMKMAVLRKSLNEQTLIEMMHFAYRQHVWEMLVYGRSVSRWVLPDNDGAPQLEIVPQLYEGVFDAR